MELFDPNIRVMCVDDDPIQIIIYQEIFRKLKAHVDFFEKSETAIEAAKKKYYNLIITDLNMPKFGGVELYFQTSEWYSHANLNIPKYILVTGMEDEMKGKLGEAIRNIGNVYLSLGFDLYFKKPIDYLEFFESTMYLLTTDIKHVKS